MRDVPVWAARLSRERRERLWTQREMAKRLVQAADDPQARAHLPERESLVRMIKDWEAGRHKPKDPYRVLYGRAFGIDEAELFDDRQATREPTSAEVTDVPIPSLPLAAIAPDADLFERITHAVEQPSRVDQQTVEWLETCLAEHRKVEDTIGSRPLLGIVRQQLGVVVELAQHARGSLADTVVDLAAQYAQFVAWMSLDIDDQAAALAWYDRAHDWALEIGDVNMATTTLSMKAHQAWSAGNARRCIRLADAARWHDGQVTPGVRGMAQQMAARGHALAGDARPARTLLDGAEALIRQAAERADDEPAWMYFYDETWFRLQRGMIELQLSNWSRAIDLLSEGLSGLPETYKRDRAWYGSCLAMAHTEAGDARAAVQVSLPIVREAVTLNRHARKELVNVSAMLAERRSPEANVLVEALREAS
ncbi:transcriptional regulator with XRE-family HTH domain [Thermocatellispora tengchongensis]|uniref:Transcriptional regulator with XRE-family HTH domain n=1 Tax=Thermocatellispora tengchongensis TaxID=1073253 RepID=A0A840NSL6_9ACTN|nr:XRE family transcriptional regulator [Thermocatellispora tengchongensis]MBB5130568.1 transcriptional regulator with XRE-family HTH domain [Thermocatellispora tengchongensis]